MHPKAQTFWWLLFFQWVIWLAYHQKYYEIPSPSKKHIFLHICVKTYKCILFYTYTSHVLHLHLHKRGQILNTIYTCTTLKITNQFPAASTEVWRTSSFLFSKTWNTFLSNNLGKLQTNGEWWVWMTWGGPNFYGNFLDAIVNQTVQEWKLVWWS
jgi:hypothetical protein